METRGWRGIAWALALVLAATGCDDGGEGDGGEAEAEPRAELTGEPPIVITILRPKKQAHRGDSVYRLEPTTAGYRFEEFDIDKATVEALVTAATADLIPSDGRKSCKDSEENVAFEITIPQAEGDPIQLLSNADCLNFAPWNVIKDGKLYVQSTGAIGAALPPIGKQVEHIVWDTWSLPTEARFELTTEPEAVEGAEAQELPLSGFQEKLLAHPDYQKHFKGVEPERIRLLCSQKRSPDCSTLLGQAILPFRDSISLTLEFDATPDAITAVHWPADDAPVQAFLESKPFDLITDSIPGGKDAPKVNVTYNAAGECRYMSDGVSHFKEDADPEACQYISAVLDYEGAEKLPPRLYYYPEINAFRLLNWMDRTDLSFYKKLKAPKADTADIEKDIIYDKFHFYATPKGELVKLRK